MKLVSRGFGVLSAVVFATPLLVLACGGEATPQAAALPANSPLSTLNAGRAQRVSYTFEGGKRADVLLFEAERVHLSAACAQPSGMLQCQAIDALRGGKTVQLGASELNSGVNPGALACRKMGRTNTTGRGPKGDEDGFCEFPDGSFASTGSVELYVVK